MMKKNSLINSVNKYNLFIIIFLIITSCSNGFCDDISKTISKEYKDSKDINIIDMVNIYPFEWDELRIFKSFHTPRDISESLGFDCNCEPIYDGDAMYLFIKNGQIIRKGTEQCNNFIFTNSKNSKVFINKETSKFEVKKVKENGNFFFTLTPLVND
ncbi:hypothetical protein [uncultured Tenacibaculum sp.]|uniref:hypothetical protein n=1 Tax=uncultured Tenacibaculum sp. TaxID=174713 RepID=UPI00261E0254|nr:hypothetical protein [uncultured Tenacibaculum sp.]